MTPRCTLDDSWERQWGISAWEPRDMTICIAAICDEGRAIVIASDRQVGVGFTSSELDESKVGDLYKDWHVAIAGSVTNATEVVLRARRLEKTLPSLMTFDVMASVEKAYRATRMGKVEGTILAAHGWTLTDFQQHGSQRLPPGTYARIDTEIALYDLEVGLLICGFDENSASIMTIVNPGVGADHFKLGFWCIGSGSTLAQASLFSRDYSWRWSAKKAAYCLYEAKKVAERATGVGDKATDVFLIRKGKEVFGLPKEQKDVLEKIYQDLKPQDLSPEHLRDLNEAFAKVGL